MAMQPANPSAATPVMAEDAAAPAHASAAGAGDQAQTVEVPVSAIGGAKEGDMVTFKVVSVDQQGGMANLAPAAGAPERPVTAPA